MRKQRQAHHKAPIKRILRRGQKHHRAHPQRIPGRKMWIPPKAPNTISSLETSLEFHMSGNVMLQFAISRNMAEILEIRSKS
ncbi:hypothetical protein BSL78_15147 [Apostichopus japonicus]|uniref:Uncharacterized protein n=1 Tax=Stichopus japonicus TaxID=307972 RepID=A0A2G8KJ21_STIJA|nr:hypothetical protein BSL78_15147 [Apostichopus japonicus]